MTKIIAVEGPDGSGKSTLLGQLSEVFDIPIHHTGGPPKNRESWILKLMDLWEFKRRSESECILLDRMPFISEQIYRRVDGKPMYDTPAKMDEQLVELQPLVIYCRCESVAFMHRQIADSPKAHKSPEHLEWVLRNYPQIVVTYDQKINQLSGRIPILRYSWPNDSFQDLVERVKCVASC